MGKKASKNMPSPALISSRSSLNGDTEYGPDICEMEGIAGRALRSSCDSLSRQSLSGKCGVAVACVEALDSSSCPLTKEEGIIFWTPSAGAQQFCVGDFIR